MYRRQVSLSLSDAGQADLGSEKYARVGLYPFGLGDCLYHRFACTVWEAGLYRGSMIPRVKDKEGVLCTNKRLMFWRISFY